MLWDIAYLSLLSYKPADRAIEFAMKIENGQGEFIIVEIDLIPFLKLPKNRSHILNRFSMAQCLFWLLNLSYFPLFFEMSLKTES
ncbi:hypothetical protein HZS_4588, partial [Henneguya salminicola]